MKNNKGNKVGGILQAMQKYHFRVLINDDVDLAQQVISCSLNVVKKQFKLLVRQPITPDIMEKVNAIGIGIGSSRINVAALDTNNNTDFSYELSGAELIDHKFDLDYASGDIATHVLTFKYWSLNTK